jgi:ribosomal protein S6--L-glutamate ligase
MKLAILSCAPNAYSTRRLREAAEQRDHRVKVLNTLKFSIDLDRGSPDLYYRQKQLSTYDAVLPRIGASITYYGTAVVRQFQEMNVYCANTSHGILNSRDKLRSLQILSRHHIGIPRTTFVRDKKDVLPAIERVGGAPVVIKLIEGTQGIGVLLADTVKQAESIIELLQSQKQNVLIQKFVAESKGKDIRAFVVGDRVVAAMRRVAQGQEFRSNVHRGGIAEPVELDEAYRETAVRCAQIMGLNVAGVDMLEGRDGPQVMEVNSSPGLEGIETCTELDIAGAVIDYIAAQVDFPGNRRAPATHGQQGLRRQRDLRARGLGVRRPDDSRDGARGSGYQRTDAVPRRQGDSQPETVARARTRGQAAVLRQAGHDAADDPRQDAPPAPSEAAGPAAGCRGRGRICLRPSPSSWRDWRRGAAPAQAVPVGQRAHR